MALDDLKRQMGSSYSPDTNGALSEENQEAQKMTADELLSQPVETLIDMEVSSMVSNRQNASEDWRRPKRLIWDQAWLDYKQIYNRAGKATWQSTTFMPLITRSVEVILANMHGAILGPEMPVEWQDRGRPDLSETIQKHNKIMAYDMEKCQFKVGFTDFLRQMILLGTSIGEVGYDKQEELVNVKERRKPSIMDSMLSKFGVKVDLERMVPKRELVKDCATFKSVDLYDIYPQPYTTDFSKDNWVIRKRLITNRELVDGSMDPDPYYRLKVPAQLLTSNTHNMPGQDPEKQVRRLAFLDYDIMSYHLEPDMTHELLEYYGPVPTWFINPELRNDPKKRYDTVPGWIWSVDGFIVRNRTSPWRDAEPPFTKGNYIRVPNQFYGLGVGELLCGLQIEKNEHRNLAIDNINMIMQKILIVNKDKIPKEEWNRLRAEPMAIWVTSNVDDVGKAIKPVDFPDMTRDVWMATQQIDQEAAETSGAVKATLGVSQGLDDAGGTTFRGQLLNQQAATERFMLYARVAEYCALSTSMKKFYQRIYQFKSYKDIDEILGPSAMGNPQGDPGGPMGMNGPMNMNQAGSKSFELISPEIMEKVAKLIPMGVLSMENKGIKLAQMERFTAQWMNEPWFKKYDMARREWIEMGMPDPDQVIFSPEEMEQYNQFRKQMLNMGMGQGPGMGPGGPEMGPVGSPGPMSGSPLPGVAMPPNPAVGPGVKTGDIAGIPI